MTPDQVRGRLAGTTSKKYLHADARGSIIALTDASGAVVAKNAYDPYGEPDAGNTGLFQYTGQIWLAEAGLYHYKARAYHPGLGRFLQTDPIGFVFSFCAASRAGGMNIYAYAGNDPVNGTDPSGLCTGSFFSNSDGSCLGGGFQAGAGSSTGNAGWYASHRITNGSWAYCGKCTYNVRAGEWDMAANHIDIGQLDFSGLPTNNLGGNVVNTSTDGPCGGFACASPQIDGWVTFGIFHLDTDCFNFCRIGFIAGAVTGTQLRVTVQGPGIMLKFGPPDLSDGPVGPEDVKPGLNTYSTTTVTIRGTYRPAGGGPVTKFKQSVTVRGSNPVDFVYDLGGSGPYIVDIVVEATYATAPGTTVIIGGR